MNPKLILAAAFSIGMAGAAFAQGQTAPTPPEAPRSEAPKSEAAKSDAAKPARACFFNRDIRGFAAPDDKTLYLRVRNKEVFRLDMMGRCPDLDWENRIAIDSRGSSSICDPVDATVLVRGPIGVDRCPVKAITRLTPEEVAALPRKARP
ncbi:MAG: hypothetical protein RL588_2594 [Pseudomonadota bacterium]|jgi:hypothetical protein